MPIEFTCRSCRSLLAVPDGTEGRKTSCPACHSVQEIPQLGMRPCQEQLATVEDSQLRVPCPQCAQLLVCDRSLVNTKGQCKNCRCVFLINDRSCGTAPLAVSWFFSCPHCEQLFEGQPGMQGRSGRCHRCGNVFVIDLQVQGDSTGTRGA